MVTVTQSKTLLLKQKNLSLTFERHSTPVQTNLTTLPTELILQVLECLPPNSRLALRATNRRFASIFHNLLDPEIFKTLHIRLTNKSITGLQDLTRNPSLTNFVTTLVFDTNHLLPVQSIEHFHRVLRENELCSTLLSDPQAMSTAYAEYQKLYYEQTRLLSASKEILTDILPKLPNLKDVVIDTAENWSIKGKDFAAGHVPMLHDFELAPAFLETALVTQNTHAFLSITSAAAAGKVAIRNWVVKSGVLFKGLRWDVFSINKVAAGLRGAQSIELCVENSECKAPQQQCFRFLGIGLTSSADSMAAVLRGAAASSEFKVLKIVVRNRADAQGFVFTDIPSLAQFLPEFCGLEELWIDGIGCEVRQLGAVLGRVGLKKVVFGGCCVAELGTGGWEEVVLGLRAKGVQVGLERAVLLEKTNRQGSCVVVSRPGFAVGGEGVGNTNEEEEVFV